MRKEKNILKNSQKKIKPCKLSTKKIFVKLRNIFHKNYKKKYCVIINLI